MLCVGYVQITIKIFISILWLVCAVCCAVLRERARVCVHKVPNWLKISMCFVYKMLNFFFFIFFGLFAFLLMKMACVVLVIECTMLSRWHFHKSHGSVREHTAYIVSALNVRTYTLIKSTRPKYESKNATGLSELAGCDARCCRRRRCHHGHL